MQVITKEQDYTVNFTDEVGKIVGIKTNNKKLLKKYNAEDAKEILINLIDNTIEKHDVNTEETSMALITFEHLSRQVVSLTYLFGGFNLLFDDITPQITEKRYKEHSGDEYNIHYYFVHDCVITDKAKEIFNNKLKGVCTDFIELVNIKYKNSNGMKYPYWKDYLKEEAKNTGYKIKNFKYLKCVEVEYKIKIK